MMTTLNFLLLTGNDIWGIRWSRDRWRHVTPKVLWCREAVRSAILATAWLLLGYVIKLTTLIFSVRVKLSYRIV